MVCSSLYETIAGESGCGERWQYATSDNIVSSRYKEILLHLTKLVPEMFAYFNLQCPTVLAVISSHYYFRVIDSDSINDLLFFV